MSFTTNPNPLISGSPGTLTYIDSTYAPINNYSYILRNSENIQVPNSSIYTSSIISYNNNNFTTLLSSLTNDGNGNFYFGGNTTGTIYKYNYNSNLITTFTSLGGSVGKISLTYYNGYLYIGNWRTNTIDKYDASGNFTVFASGTNINQPNGLVFNNSGELYIANFGSSKIVKYTKSTNTYVPIATLSNPYGLALDSSSNLYIATWSIYVYKYNITTQVLSIYFYDTVDTNSQPYGLVFDQYNNLYITAFNWTYIYKVAPNQTYSKIIGSQSGRPTGITLYNNTLYYLTNNNGTTIPWRINKYNLYLEFTNLILDTSQYLSIYSTTNSQTVASNLYVIVFNQMYYFVGNVNLSSIFSTIPSGYSGAYALETHLFNSDNIDLNKIFLPYISGEVKAPTTHYYTPQVKDLNEIFKKL